ncbi:MAG TPA: zinc ABC transporter substrate-binding protein [Candidatus Faecousia intestinavium]|nr:zinc ABC transporter substrate-binding protein [Candidatus Faecousia intestinavium]
MKRRFFLLGLLASVFFCTLSGCARTAPPAQIAATTLPVYDFTSRICADTPVTVTRLVTEQVSCLHDYSLNVRQVRAAEAAQVIVISGAGLEDFLGDLLEDENLVDASAGIPLICPEESHDHDHEEDGHHHEQDPHIWLSPANARQMARNIFDGLSQRYPEYADTMEKNLKKLLLDLEELESYGREQLEDLSIRELITFHDGFSYFAQAFDLTILEAIEEESGSEASAKELIHLITLTREHSLKAVFTEKTGSVSAAGILSRETGCPVYSLDMAMSGDSYFEAMYHNIDTIKEALQ